MVDCRYFLAATLSTVGYGDIAPEEQDSRTAAIFMLPLGLCILGMVVATVGALSRAAPFKPVKEPSPDQPFLETIAGRLVVIFVKIYSVVVAGAIFFYVASDSDAMFSTQGSLTFIDALYASVVTALSVGYGDIVPTSSWTRGMTALYMLSATLVVGGQLGAFIELYVNHVVGEEVIVQIIDSTIWVHKVLACRVHTHSLFCLSTFLRRG